MEGSNKMKEYCNICGRELLEDMLVVDTAGIETNKVQGCSLK
ncbi:hypothetical protein [Methanosarcina barkeri]|nr:hypothetical protein [Methanosarcina barkeri]